MQLDICVCTHIRWWHIDGKCWSCSKANSVKEATVACEFRTNALTDD